MLARSGPLPTGDYAYELRDGFRCLASTVGRLRVLSRQWWKMTPHLPELAGMPRGVALDGELIAFGDDGKPSFPRLCQRGCFMVMRTSRPCSSRLTCSTPVASRHFACRTASGESSA